MTENQEFLSAILESIQDGVYFVDTGRRITYWNSGAESITGYFRHEVVGRFCHENLLLHCTPEGVRLCDGSCPLQATLTDGRPREAFVLLLHKQGHRVPVRVRATAVRDSNGVIAGAAEVFEEGDFTCAGARQTMVPGSLRLVDNLTGLPNQELIAARLAERLGELTRCGIPFGVLLIDIDLLGKINLNFGRDAGDAILRMAAHTLAKGVPSQHLLGRWEQDQFLAIVDNCDTGILSFLAERLIAMLANSGISWWGENVRVTASIAGTAAKPSDDEAEITSRASRILADVQQAGGGAFRIA